MEELSIYLLRSDILSFRIWHTHSANHSEDVYCNHWAKKEAGEEESRLYLFYK